MKTLYESIKIYTELLQQHQIQTAYKGIIELIMTIAREQIHFIYGGTNG